VADRVSVGCRQAWIDAHTVALFRLELEPVCHGSSRRNVLTLGSVPSTSAKTGVAIMTTAEDVVLAAIAAVERRDVRGLLDLYHDEVEFHDAPCLPYGGVVRGKPAVIDHTFSATGWAATWHPLQPTPAERAMSPRVVASNGEDVVVEYRQRGVTPGGERFDAPVLAAYKVRDRRLVRAQMFHYDTVAVVNFLRAAREPPGVGGA